MQGGLSLCFRQKKQKTTTTPRTTIISELLDKLYIAHLRNFRIHQFRFYINTSDAVGE